MLLGTAANGSANAIEVTVAGTFFTIYKEYDDTALRLPIPLARKLMRVSGATSWVALLNNTELTTGTIEAIRPSLLPKDFQIVSWTELADFYNKTVVLFSKQVDVVKIIIGLIIILTISNTQTMSSTLAIDALLLAFVTTLLASVMPAWRASRMNIVDALRCNQ